jgi:hypothetical protein
MPHVEGDMGSRVGREQGDLYFQSLIHVCVRESSVWLDARSTFDTREEV